MVGKSRKKHESGNVGARVLHIGKFVPPEPGGIERFSVDVLRALTRHGADVGLLGHRAPGRGKPPRDSFPIYSVPTRAQIVHVPISPSFPKALLGAVRAFRPNLLHLHMPNVSAFCALMFAKCRRLPWIVHWHADVVSSDIDRRLAIAYRGYRPLEQRVLRRAEVVIGTSEAYVSASSALSDWKSKTQVLPLGLDPGSVAIVDHSALEHARHAWPDGSLRVLFVGRLSYYKGVRVLVDALHQLSGVHLVIAGDGAERRLIEKRLSSDNVTLLGAVSDDLRNALLQEAEVLVLPSLERTEAFGLVLLEAMASGLPAVVSDVPGSGMRDVVTRGGHGLLVPPGDADALRCQIKALRDDPSILTGLRDAIGTSFNAHFHIDPVARRLMDIYDSLDWSK